MAPKTAPEETASKPVAETAPVEEKTVEEPASTNETSVEVETATAPTESSQPSEISFTEKMAQRAKRFGLPVSDDVKKELTLRRRKGGYYSQQQ
jgi:hypothetical protein